MELEFIEHEGQLTLAIWERGDHPLDSKMVAGASLGGDEFLDYVDDLQRAWEEAVLRKADHIHHKQGGWADNPSKDWFNRGDAAIDVYRAYVIDGLDPAEIADEFGIGVANVHDLLAYYYRHADELREKESIPSLSSDDSLERERARELIDRVEQGEAFEDALEAATANREDSVDAKRDVTVRLSFEEGHGHSAHHIDSGIAAWGETEAGALHALADTLAHHQRDGNV